MHRPEASITADDDHEAWMAGGASATIRTTGWFNCAAKGPFAAFQRPLVDPPVFAKRQSVANPSALKARQRRARIPVLCISRPIILQRAGPRCLDFRGALCCLLRLVLEKRAPCFAFTENGKTCLLRKAFQREGSQSQDQEHTHSQEYSAKPAAEKRPPALSLIPSSEWKILRLPSCRMASALSPFWCVCKSGTRPLRAG